MLLVSLKKKCIRAVLLLPSFSAAGWQSVTNSFTWKSPSSNAHAFFLLSVGRWRGDGFVESAGTSLSNSSTELIIPERTTMQKKRKKIKLLGQKLFSVCQPWNFWIKHLRCYCEAMHTAQINETTPKQQSPRGALYPKLSYFLTTQQMSVKNWNISSTKIWCVLSHVFEFCCCIKLNVPESWNGNRGIYSIKQTMSFLKHREIFLDARRSASEGKLHTSLLQTNESWDFNI